MIEFVWNNIYLERNRELEQKLAQCEEKLRIASVRANQLDAIVAQQKSRKDALVVEKRIISNSNRKKCVDVTKERQSETRPDGIQDRSKTYNLFTIVKQPDKVDKTSALFEKIAKLINEPINSTATIRTKQSNPFVDK